MSFRYEATSEFNDSLLEVHELVKLARNDDANRNLFLKYSIIGLVTKFQVFTESVFSEFRKNIDGASSKNLSTYAKLNSLRMSLFEEQNTMMGLKGHENFTSEKLKLIIEYLKTTAYLYNDRKIGKEFRFRTRFPLGKTGSKELIALFKQINGSDGVFDAFKDDDFHKLDSILQMRHLAVHRDRFNGTDVDVENGILFLTRIANFIDKYLSENEDVIKG